MQRTRDPELTKSRILEAALSEFAEKGFAGARVNRIAVRSGSNKRMLYYYFGSKEGLFKEILHRKLEERRTLFQQSSADVAEWLEATEEMITRDTRFVRLLEWEALDSANKPLIDEDERREACGSSVQRLRGLQSEGALPEDVNPEMLFLLLLSVVIWPVAFPQMTRLVTGTAPDDPEFVRRRTELFKAIGTKLHARLAS